MENFSCENVAMNILLSFILLLPIAINVFHRVGVPTKHIAIGWVLNDGIIAL